MLLISGDADSDAGAISKNGWSFLQKPFSSDTLSREGRVLLDSMADL